MSVQVSERAAREVHRLLAEKSLPSAGGMRLGVKGGGCSGFSYVLRLESEQRENDRVFEVPVKGAAAAAMVRIFVDPKSYLYLEGIELDFQEDLNQRGFVFQNPNASGSCGCGSSFSV